jgi:hypothetical protein
MLFQIQRCQKSPNIIRQELDTYYIVLLCDPPITMHPTTHFTPPAPCLFNDEHQETLRQEEKRVPGHRPWCCSGVDVAVLLYFAQRLRMRAWADEMWCTVFMV